MMGERGWLGVALLGSAAVAVWSCVTLPTCEEDGDCGTTAYCHPTQKFCFERPVASREDPDAGTDELKDAGIRDAGENAGESDASVPPVEDDDLLCNEEGWCWVSPRPVGAALNAVWVWYKRTATYAVGEEGVILRRDIHGAYKLIPNPSTAALHDVWGSADDDVWIVGEDATVLRWNGVSLTVHAVPTTQTLRGIWGASPNEVWAVGDEGTILRWDGAEWSLVTSGVSVDLHDVGGTGANDLWVVGAEGTILHDDGSGWRAVPSATTKTVTHIAFAEDSPLLSPHALAQNALLFFNGASFEVEQLVPGALLSLCVAGDGQLIAMTDDQLWIGNRMQWTSWTAPRPGINDLVCNLAGSEFEWLAVGARGAVVIGAGVEGDVETTSAGRPTRIAATRADEVWLAPPDVTRCRAANCERVTPPGLGTSNHLTTSEVGALVVSDLEGNHASWDGQGWKSGTWPVIGLWKVAVSSELICGLTTGGLQMGRHGEELPVRWASSVLVSVWAKGNECWAAGGGQWIRCSGDAGCFALHNGTGSYTDVSGSPGGDRFVSSSTGVILRWDGSKVHQYGPFGTPIVRVVLISDDEGWAAGANGQVFRWNGSEWSAHSRAPVAVRDFAAARTGTTTSLWIIGTDDRVMRFRQR